MKKVLAILTAICLIIISPSVFADTKTVSRVVFKIPYPYIGMSRIEQNDIWVSEGVKIAGFTWVNVDTHTFMQGTEKYEEDITYAIRMFFEAEEGYDFADPDELLVTLNNVIASPEYIEDYNQYKFEMKFHPMTEEEAKEGNKNLFPNKTPEPEEHPLKSIEVEVDEPVAGEPLPEKCRIKTNITNEFAEYEIGKRAEDGFYPYWDTTFFPGLAYGNITYRFRVKLVDDSIPRLPDLNIKGYINGEEYDTACVKDANVSFFADYRTGDMPRKEKIKIEDFAFTIAEPKAGEKPSETAEEVNDGYNVTKVVWTPDDGVFEEGKEYKVEIFFTKEDEYTTKDVKTTVNGKEAIQQGWSNPAVLMIDRLCAEYTFPKLESGANKTAKKVEWSNASSWAVEELNKANEKELIPTIFEKQDLTTNITRKEFAYIAVRLWEAVSGRTAAAGSVSPFSDCDDAEVLKAYNLEITKGTSDTAFSPDELITREQMATMMTRALQKAGIDTTVDLDKAYKFADDNEIHSWGKEAVYYMANIGIIKGVGENNFGVLGGASKEQSLLISVRSAEKFSK